MIRDFSLFNSTLLFLVLFGVAVSSTLAQDQFTRHCREQVDQANPNSKEQVLATFMLTSALRRQDLSSAIFNAMESVKLARSISDDDCLMVASSHVEMIQTMIDGRPTEDVGFSIDSVNLIGPELQLHLLLPQMEAELWSGKSTANLEYLLKVCQLAAAECSDPYLVIQQETLDLYVRVYKLDASPISETIIQKRDELKQKSRQLGYTAGTVVALIVEGSGLRLQNRIDRQIGVLGEALSIAESGQDIILSIRCNQLLSIAYRLRKEWDDARGHALASLRLAESFGSQPLIMTYLATLMSLELQSGRPLQAANYRIRIEEHATYQNLDPLLQNALNRVSVWAFGPLGDSERVEFYRGLILKPSLVEWIRKLKEKADSEEARALELAQANTEISENATADEQQHQAETRRLKESNAAVVAKTERALDFFKNYSLAATLTVVLLVTWFVLLLMRSRLKTVHLALDSERETSSRSKTKCDELAIRLNRLQRMESLGLMAGSIAHDFNNILVGVLGNAELIQLGKNASPESGNDEFVNQRISSIIKSAEKAASLSRQMLAYAGKQYIAKRPTDLNDLIRQYQSILESACLEGQELKLNLCPDPIVSKVDLTQIEQAVLNLVTNAVQASSKNGQITITTGRQTIKSVEDDCSLYGTRLTGGDFCFIDVADSGGGISQLDMERIFEPFFSNSELGRGLGLSVVYGVIVGHDGFIKCSSALGQGTCFRVLLPFSIESVINSPVDLDDELPQHDEFEAEFQALHARKILVIDDEEAVLDLCSQLIELNGWEVITALSGEDGLRIATQYADELSCILVDVVMPEMGASELLRELDDRGINLPVVVMSGFSHTRLDFFLDRCNVVSIVEKPFSANEIKRALLTAIDIGQNNSIEASDRPIGNSTGYPARSR